MLEGIRLALPRLHAGASDLTPFTTLMDAVRLIGHDMAARALFAARISARICNEPPLLSFEDCPQTARGRNRHRTDVRFASQDFAYELNIVIFRCTQ